MSYTDQSRAAEERQADAVAIEALAEQLLVEACANPGIRITDEAKARDYFRARALATMVPLRL